MKNVIFNTVDQYRELMLKTHDYIWKNPETGYKEIKTERYLAKEFEKLGYTLTKAGNIPGFFTEIDTGKPGPKVLIMGEMDSLICYDHPDADPETGAVHCCGHSAQASALLGIAASLTNKEITDALYGKIMLCAVPAEELIEIEYRSELKKKGIIKYMGGKTEFLHRGYFDGVDIAFMVHATSIKTFFAKLGSVGCMAKRVVYKGKSAHAGGSPWAGCNALYAATQGLSAINAIRETFRERDIIRVHPIITKGGNAVNAIPDTVILESFVRGSNFDAIKEANKKINRAICGAALSLGANVDIQDTPGYAPLINSSDMLDVARDAAEYFDIDFVYDDTMGSGSTDMGDFSGIMPSIHPYAPGAVGTSHGADYYIESPELACVESAKWQIMMLYLLLKDNAERANKIIADFKPKFKSIRDYLNYIDELEQSGDRITYTENGAEVRI